MTSAYVYRLFDPDGALLYVGVASWPPDRIRCHRGQPWLRGPFTATTKYYAARGDALAAEKAAIRAERPRHNVIYNGTAGHRELYRRQAAEFARVGPPWPPQADDADLQAVEAELDALTALRGRGAIPLSAWLTARESLLERFADVGRALRGSP